MIRFVVLCTGLLLMVSLSGCCCLSRGCGGGYSAGYPYGGGGGGCPGGACGASARGYPTAFNAGRQAAFAPGTTTAFVDPIATF
ncbi:MAG: hypothetical protein ABGZ35_02750 [Planctomycetaceae bacterium]